jgi:hypothetical protein
MTGPSFTSRKGKRRPTAPTGDLGLGGDSGKGDSPRNCFSAQFRDNYSLIDWGREPGWSTRGINFKKVYRG